MNNDLAPEPPTEPDDHRSRVGAARREKTRQRLLESALSVFASKGADAPLIEDFIAAAGVARGTFYNYFRTTHELLAAVSGQMSDEVLCVVDPVVQQFSDPAERIAAGTRLYMEMAYRYPLWGTFITRVGARLASRGKLLDVYLNRDIATGMATHRFSVANALVTRDIVLGSIFYGIETMLTEPTHEHHAEELVETFLRGMGLPRDEAKRIAFMPLPRIGAVQGPIFSKLPSDAATKTKKRRPETPLAVARAQRKTTAKASQPAQAQRR